ncbi:MAG: hypothetical protein WAR83_16300, partial [Flavobacteriales bacterium]
MRVFITMITIACGVLGYAQTSIRGLVTDEATVPMVGVVAYIGDAAMLATSTGKDGAFILEGMRAGRHTVHLRIMG